MRLNLMYVIHIAGTCTARACESIRGVRAAGPCSTARRCPTMPCGTGACSTGRMAGAIRVSTRTAGYPSPNASVRHGRPGRPRDWVHETAVDCRVIYDWHGSTGCTTMPSYRILPRSPSGAVRAAYRLAALPNEFSGSGTAERQSKIRTKIVRIFRVTAAGCGPLTVLPTAVEGDHVAERGVEISAASSRSRVRVHPVTPLVTGNGRDVDPLPCAGPRRAASRPSRASPAAAGS